MSGSVPRTQAHPPGHGGDTVPIRLAPNPGRHSGHQARTGILEKFIFKQLFLSCRFFYDTGG